MKNVKTNRSLAAYILLNLVTCGIYSFFFIHSFAEDVNILCKEDGKHTSGLLAYIFLSFITCGIYGIYWWYKNAERIHDAGVRSNIDTQVSGSTFLIWYIIGIFLCSIGIFYAIYLMIRAINMLAVEYNETNLIEAPEKNGDSL